MIDDMGITFRVEGSDEPGSGQARVAFNYSGTMGTFDWRMDLDGKGTSVDLGSHGELDAVSSVLLRHKNSYTSRGAFEKPFRNEKVFANFVKEWGTIFGIEPAIWQRVAHVQRPSTAT